MLSLTQGHPPRPGQSGQGERRWLQGRAASRSHRPSATGHRHVPAEQAGAEHAPGRAGLSSVSASRDVSLSWSKKRAATTRPVPHMSTPPSALGLVLSMGTEAERTSKPAKEVFRKMNQSNRNVIDWGLKATIQQVLENLIV